MKLLRHILSHIFLILFIAALVSVYYYRTLLLPGEVVNSIEAGVKKVYPPALAFVSKRDYFWSIKGERIVSFDDLTFLRSESGGGSKTKDIELAEAEVSLKGNAEKNIEKEKNIEPVDVSKPAEIKVAATENKTEKDVPVVITEVNDISSNNSLVESAKKNNDFVEASSVEAKVRDSSAERELLINARTAFNQRSLRESEKYYIELTQFDNNNPDPFGELGNVYYSQGKWDEAGQAYYEAAVRLLKQGNQSQVLYLQRVISGLNTELAEKLAQTMMQQ